MDTGGKRSARADASPRGGWFLAGTALAAVALLAVRGTLSDRDEPTGMVRIETPLETPAHPLGASTAAPRSPLLRFELHGVGRSPVPAALLAEHDQPPRWFRQGDVVRDGIVLVSVARGHVILAQGLERFRIDLPQRLGGADEAVPAALRGLRPEPRPPSGERSAAELQAGRTAPREPPTPEEREAARLGQLPVPEGA